MTRIVKISTLLTAVLILIAPPGAKAATLELKALIEEARANNPTLNSARAMLGAKRAGVRVKSSYEDPTLKIERGDIPFSSVKESMFTRYTLSQAIPFPGKLSLMEQMAEKDAASASAQLDAKELEIIEAVKSAYYEYAYIHSAIDETNGIKSSVDFMAEIAKTRYGTGAVAQQEVIKTQTETLMIANDRIMLNSERTVVASRLKSLLGRDQAGAIEGGAQLETNLIDIKLDEVVNQAIQKTPDVRMLSAEAEAGELGARLAGRSYYPDVMLGIAPTQRNGRFDTFDVMLQLSIPISPWKYSAITDEASSMASSARNRLYAMQIAKAQEVKEIATQIKSMAEQIELYKTGILPQSQFSFDSALKNYQTGKSDFLMLLDAQRELKKIKIAYLKTILEYRKKIAALERAAGIELIK